MNRYYRGLGIVGPILILFWLSCSRSQGVNPAKGGGKESPISLAAELSVPSLDKAFAAYYAPVAITVQPAVPRHPLPLEPRQIQNWEEAVGRAGLNQAARKKLLSTGLVAVDFGRQDNVAEAYKVIKDKRFPIFVTSDSVLHLYHIQFDETLKNIELQQFAKQLREASRAMQKEMVSRARVASGEVAQAYWKAAGLFTVGLKLQEPKAEAPKEISVPVAWELTRIEKHQGFPDPAEAEQKALFKYCEDYSQYVPRGHYTTDEELKKYFKAMMWYGRMTLLLKGADPHGPEEKALVSPEEAKAQTLAAAAIAGLVTQVKAEGKTVAETWQSIYMVTAFYVGFSDDLGIPEYRQALKQMFGAAFTLADLGARHAEFLERAKAMRQPAIYSGTGAVELSPEGGNTLGGILGKTQGFRFMGQRYVPDSYILGKMVVPTVKELIGQRCLTTVDMPVYGPARGFPRGLDVFAVFGSDRAKAILDQTNDSQYRGYDQTLARLRAEFQAIPESRWHQNLYWLWLDALRTLALEDRGEGYPTFMSTTAWQDKQLNAALGSWSSLRHDTILYVKQSYTAAPKGLAIGPRPVVGYVEPVPRFYAKLLALTTMSKQGLMAMGVIDEPAKLKLSALETIFQRLLEISQKELVNQSLSPEEYNFIAGFGERLNSVVTGSSSSSQKTTLIADVHTDQNSREVMEEGTGYLRLLAVAYQLPEGHILIGGGPVYSYYEFRHPMSDRLTDEKWRDRLESGKGPALPEWTKSFAE